MKKILFILSLLFVSFVSNAQQDAQQLYETGKTFVKQGDYSNAILVFTKALQLQPSNVDIAKDLAVVYLIQKDNPKALDVLQPFIEKDIADDQAYQLDANIYKAMNNAKDAERVYKKGLKKFPESGPLYNEYGEMLWLKQDKSAITQWEMGIETDPQYSSNYFNAANYYFSTNDFPWALIYAEVFINLEPSTSRTPIAKNIMLEGYKRLFLGDYLKNYKAKGSFEKAFVDEMNKISNLSNAGITPESLIMIRTRFNLDWYENYAEKYPFKLFEMHKGLLEKGLFEAYNQWLIGTVQNLAAYQTWTGTHHTEYEQFTKLQENRIFKQPKGQYYHK